MIMLVNTLTDESNNCLNKSVLNNHTDTGVIVICSNAAELNINKKSLGYMLSSIMHMYI